MTSRQERNWRASFAQRSMWAAAQRGRGAPLNVFVLRWRLHGQVRLQALEAALGDLCARHPTLRVRLVMEAGQLRQIVREPEPVPLKISEAEGSDPATRLETAMRLSREAGLLGMDLVNGPVFKVLLLRLSDTDHLLSFVVHHAVCDGWSSQILLKDLAALYGARVEGYQASLPEISEQFADFAQDQWTCYESGGFAEEIEYWQKELADPPPAIELPAIRPRRGSRDWECAYPAQLETPEVLEAMRELARGSRVTVFAVLLAELSVLLHRRTGAMDMLIGVSTLNRWRKSSLLFVGSATNLLPARIRINPELTFVEHCVQVQATLRALLTFGRLPFELLLRQTQPSALSPLPLPVWCQFREAAPHVESAGLKMVPLEIERASLQCEMELDLMGSSAGLRCEFAYRTSLFAQGFVSDLMLDYSALIRDLPSQWQAKVSELAGHDRPCGS